MAQAFLVGSSPGPRPLVTGLGLHEQLGGRAPLPAGFAAGAVVGAEGPAQGWQAAAVPAPGLSVAAALPLAALTGLVLGRRSSARQRRAATSALGAGPSAAAARGRGRGRAAVAAGSAAGQASGLRYPGVGGGEDLRRFALDLAALFQGGGAWPWSEMEVLVQDATKLLQAEKTLERIQVKPGGHINVVGDVHGQFFDLYTIWEENGLPSASNPYIFNGDFVDRGSYSLETLMTLLAWKVACPADVHLARGNHEAHSMNVPYGFTGEVLTKLGPEAYAEFQTLFDQLPLAHVVNDHALVVHGGLPRDTSVRLADIEALDRSQGPEDARRIFTDLQWADPCDKKGQFRSQRGEDIVVFGPDVTKAFLDANGLGLLIRSHEVKDEGFEWAHDKRCLTVFSAPQYCDTCDNKGAVIRLNVPEGGGPPETEIRVFTVGPRPDFYVPAMAYSPMSPTCRKYLSGPAKKLLQGYLQG